MVKERNDLPKIKRTVESYTREINKVLGDKDTVWLDETDLNKVRKILSEIDNKFGNKTLDGLKEAYYVVDRHSEDAWISSKPTCHLTMEEFEGIDRDGHYFSTEEKAMQSIGK